MRKLTNKTFRLAHLQWRIQSVPKSELPEGTVGICGPPFDGEICIYEQGGMEDLDTLFHEMVHAMDFAYNIKLTESQVCRIGHLMAFMLRDNPWIHAYVKQKVKEEYPNA